MSRPASAEPPASSPSSDASAAPKKSRTATYVGIGVASAIVVGAGITLGVVYGGKSSSDGDTAADANGGAANASSPSSSSSSNAQNVTDPLPSFGFYEAVARQSSGAYVPVAAPNGGSGTVRAKAARDGVAYEPAVSDRFGHVRVSADGTSMVEVVKRFPGTVVALDAGAEGGGVSSTSTTTVNGVTTTGGDTGGTSSNDVRPQHALVEYERDGDNWTPIVADLSSSRFATRYYGDLDEDVRVVADTPRSFDVSERASYAAVAERSPSGIGRVRLYARDASTGALVPPRSLSIGTLSEDGEGGTRFGKVVRFLGDTRLLVASSSRRGAPGAGGVTIFERNPAVGLSPDAPWFVRPRVTSISASTLRPADASMESATFGDACAGDRGASVIVASNSANRAFHIFTRADATVSFSPSTGEQTVPLHASDGDIADIAVVSDSFVSAIVVGLPSAEKVVVYRRTGPGAQYRAWQTLSAPRTNYDGGASGGPALRFGTVVECSADGRALAVGTSPSVGNADDLRNYTFLYRLDTASGLYFDVSPSTKGTTADGGYPQYVTGKLGGASHLSVRTAGSSATVTRGCPMGADVATYVLAPP